MPDIGLGAGLLDTSVLVEPADSSHLPSEGSMSALSLAELAAGPHASTDASERARRQQRLQVVEATFDALPFDTSCARAYGRVYAAIAQIGPKARGPRAVDLLIAATAIANDVPLYTRNPDDMRGLDSLLDVIAVSSSGGPRAS